MLVYLNGEYLPREEAKVSVEDRGFVFADGVYEVVRIVKGRLHRMQEHLDRMADGLESLQIELEDVGIFNEIAERLMKENDLGQDATIYMQVTRGAAPRRHAFPEPGTKPSVFALARPYTPHPESLFENGVGVVTTSDIRWARCDIKSIALLPNVLANQKAKAAGAQETIFIRDGVLLEGSQSNLFGVRDGTLITYPASNYILAGITRAEVIDLARELEIPVKEGPLYAEEFDKFDELFLTGTTTEVMPIVTVDGRQVGNGRPGPVAKRLLKAYREQL